jgi:hypothetical protein
MTILLEMVEVGDSLSGRTSGEPPKPYSRADGDGLHREAEASTLQAVTTNGEAVTQMFNAQC